MLSQQVISSFIKCLSHDKNMLTVEFKNGTRIRYLEILQNVYLQMCSSESVGKFYTDNIKGKYKGFKLSADQA